MELLHKRCAGLDVHKEQVTAAVRIVEGAKVRWDVKEFSTVTSGLEALSEFLTKHEVTHVVMEATGVYWRPVWHVLDDSFELSLVNAAHVKAVPGRKTDVNDAQWLADLLAHGLMRGSFVPPREIEEMRQLMRTRRQLTRSVAQNSQRIQKVLEDMNIKVGDVLSDVLGASGRAILRTLIDGESDPVVLANAAVGAVKKKKHAQLAESLRGRPTDHHRFLLKMHLDLIEALEEQIASVDKRVEVALAPFRFAIQLLTSIPGVGEQMARLILAEIGTDMTRFPTAAHLVSWAGLCPRQDESAGKIRSRRLRKSSPWLKTALTQAAWGAARAKNTYLQAQYFRIKSRRGSRKAAIAVAASILTIAYHLLSRGTFHEEKGGDYFAKRDEAREVKRLAARLNRLGYTVAKVAAPAASS